MSDDTEAKRPCLGCQDLFLSSWIGERICGTCKAHAEYKGASVYYDTHSWVAVGSEEVQELCKNVANDEDVALPANHDWVDYTTTFNGVDYPNQGE